MSANNARDLRNDPLLVKAGGGSRFQKIEVQRTTATYFAAKVNGMVIVAVFGEPWSRSVMLS